MKEKEELKMTPLMKFIKAGHNVTGNTGIIDLKELEKRRNALENLSKFAAPSHEVAYKVFRVKDMKAMWAEPKFTHNTKPVILYCHGGGFSTGDIGYSSVLAGKLAIHTGLNTVSYMYRLSPENMYPAAIEDTMHMWNHLMLQGYGADDVIVAGDSAGGNLALELCLNLKASKRMLPKALILMSPWTDMTMTSSSYDKYGDLDPVLSKEYIEIVRNAYAGSDANFWKPQFSPLYAELDNMPPTFVQVGSNEILRGDSEELVNKMNEAGSIAHLKVYNECWHVFQ